MAVDHTLDQLDVCQVAANPVRHFGVHLHGLQGRAWRHGHMGLARFSDDEVTIAMRFTQFPGPPAVLGAVEQHDIPMGAEQGLDRELPGGIADLDAS